MTLFILKAAKNIYPLLFHVAYTAVHVIVPHRCYMHFLSSTINNAHMLFNFDRVRIIRHMLLPMQTDDHFDRN